MKALSPLVPSLRRATSLALRSIAALSFLVLSVVVAQAADDPYWRWAVAHFGHTAASDPAQAATLWGEQADPDGDGLRNLLEYTADTDPLARTTLSDCYHYSVPAGGPPSARYPQLTAWLRTDDPDLRVVCQTSPDLGSWWPQLPFDFDQPPPVNAYVYEQEVGASRGLRQMRYTDAQSLAGRPGAFLRLLVARRGQTVAGPGLEPFTFTSQPSTRAASVVRSNTIVLGGFTGTLSFAIPAGVTLYVNGVAVSGSVAVVKAGDHLWMEAYAPGTAGVPRHFDLTIGGYTTRWTITAAGLAAVPTGSAALPSGSGPESGYTPVEAGVSEAGAAQISIPIVVSPGTAGMQPKLAISYSSQGGNGPLGLGFSLSGLSAIARTGATVAQDGFKGGIAFDAGDRFALDGQRLIAISGADGADGTEYRLEFDPTSRIRSYGVLGSGPDRWTVETKAGLILEFGWTAISRVTPEGGASPLIWAVETIRDTAGNEINFSYDVARERGELLLSRVAYTSNASIGLATNQEVICEYEDRPDTRRSYVGGFDGKMLKRLRAIESRAKDSGGTMQRVRRYEIGYNLSGTSKRSRLQSITEFSTTSATGLVTTIDWGVDADPVAILPATKTNVSTQGYAVGQDSPSHDIVADFDGDGKSDILPYNWPTQNGKWSLYLAKNNLTPDGSGVIFKNPILTDVQQSGDLTRQAILAADYNGDGMIDILLWDKPFGNQRYNLILSNGNGFNAAIATDIQADADGYRPVIAADFNGDGRTDLLVWNKPFNNSRYNLYLATEPGFAPAIPTDVKSWDWESATNQLPGDYNGDGLTDMLMWHEPFLNFRYNLYLGTGSGFRAAIPTDMATHGNSSIPDTAVDVNGDGLTDVLVWYKPFNTSAYHLYLSKGNGTFEPPVTTNFAPWDNPQLPTRLTCDFNKDGLLDMLSWHNPFQNQRYNAHLGNGSAFDPAIACDVQSWENPTVTNQVADFDGDGRTDVLVWYAPFNNSRYNIYFSADATIDLIQGVSNGHGGYTKFAYKPLTDASVHTKGTGSTYPCYDLQASMYVVSSVTSRNGIDGDALTGAGAGTPGENTVTYRYGGAWTCLDGRGFQGFKAVETTDATAGIVSRTEYESSSPLLGGRPKHSEQRLLVAPARGSALISSSDATWTATPKSDHPSGRTTYFVQETSSVSSSYEVNRPAATALVKTVTRSGPGPGGSVTYDANANLLQSTTTTTAGGDTFTETVTNTYNDQTGAKWFLGRLATSSVTKTAPATPAVTRSSSFAYHPTTGLLTQEVIEPNETTLRQQKDYVHDGFGNIATSTLSTAGEASRTTTTFYTPDGRFVSETRNAKSHAETKTYDPLLGNVLTQTGPNGLTTSWEYDALGRPVREVRPDGTETRSFYRRVTASTAGAPPRAVHFVRVQSSGGAPRTVWYDLLDREIRTDAVSFDGRTVSAHKVYNSRGEVTDASQPYFAGDTPLYSTMLYDAVGRETRQTDPGPRITITAYNGLTTSVTNPKNQTVSTTANAMGWTVQTTDAAGKSINRSYDAYGNLKTVTDPAGNTTTLGYDVRGNKTSMSEPNSGASSFTYNGFGELKTQTNAAGQQVSLSYDVLGRVLSRTEPEGATTFTYDTAAHGIGQLAAEQSGEFVRVFFYDALSRPTATVETHGFHRFAVSRSYDVYGRPDALTFPTGLGVRQSYTALGHLAMVQNAANPALFHWAALQVNARGQVTQEVLGNGVVTDRAFDPQTGLVDGITTSFNAAGDIQKLEFNFDLIGNLAERRDVRYATPFIETFGYDTLNRLTGVSGTGVPPVTASYNDLGNLTGRTDVGTLSYTGANGAGPHAVTSVASSIPGMAKSCSYDVKGNRVFDGQSALDYSSFNKPTRIRKGGDTLRFDYGPDRALYRQTLFRTDAQGRETQTVREYIGGLYERETTNDGLVRHIHYVAGGSGVVAIQTDERSAATTAQRTRYIHKDHLGSVDVITDSAGAVVERQSFDAWGRRRTLTHDAGNWLVTYPAAPASAETHRGFTGHEMLDAVGLVHMGGRVYDPLTARFLSPDPFVQSPDNLQNLNRYSYVLNNPLSFTDPSGFFFKSIGKFLKKYWKPAVAIGLGLVTGGAFAVAAGFQGSVIGAVGASLTGGAGFSFSTAVAFGVGSGFGSAFSGTLLAGGSVGDALRAGLSSGVRGGISGGIFQQIDVALPDWSKTFDVNKPMFSAERIVQQVQRMTVRAGASDAIAHLQGGKGGVALRRTLAWDSLGLAQDVMSERQWRSEIANGLHKGRENEIRSLNQGFATATKNAVAKLPYGEAVVDFVANNFGIPWGTEAGVSRNWSNEGSAFSNTMSFDVPGMHQISLYHDFAVTAFDALIDGRNFPSASKAFSITSMVPYAAFVYGRFGNEARMRSGESGR